MGCRDLIWRVLGVAVAAATAAGGCADVDWQQERAWRGVPEPVGSAGSPVARDERMPTESRPLRWGDGRSPRVMTEASASGGPASGGGVDGALLKIQLTNEDGSTVDSESAGRGYLANGPAGPVARVLEVLYPPVGSGGTATHPYLLYRSREAWSAAAAILPQLDHPSLALEPADEPRLVDHVFARAVGMYYVRWRPAGRVNRSELQRIADLFDCVAASTGAPVRYRWAGAILAGHVKRTFLSDKKGAQASFEQADTVAEPGSVEQMVAVYYQAVVSRDLGDTTRTRELVQRIWREFDRYKDTRVYERCRSLVGRD